MLDQNSVDKITALAGSSELARYNWGGRGKAPAGYIKGMAICYALCLQKLMAKDSAAIAMVLVVENGHDVFDHYEDKLRAAGLVTDGASDVDRLRALFVVLTGLGVRESSGRYCCGRDTTAAIPPSSDTVEAGLFQQSWDSRRASPEIEKLFFAYLDPDYLGIFSEGVKVRPGDLDSYGSGDGETFQDMCKTHPSFAVQCAAIGLRTLYTHWGPIVRREAELRPEADALFRQVQGLVGANAPAVAQKPAVGWISSLLRALLAAFRGAPAKPTDAPVTPTPVPASDAPWMPVAIKEIGFHEIGENHGIEKYVIGGKTGGTDGEFWCADYANYCFETVGIPGTRSAMARSFSHHPNFIKLAGPAYGAVVVMWRGDPNGTSGHVYFYKAETKDGIIGLGGNQKDSVCEQLQPRARVLGYWWPKSVPLPKIGKIIVNDSGAASGGSEV